MDKNIFDFDLNYKRDLHKNFIILVVLGAIMALCVVFISTNNYLDMKDYLPVHSILEVIAVVTASLIFAVGWNTYSSKLATNIIFLSILFFGVAVFDFSHILSYAGMPDYVTESSPEKAINFWLAGRILVSLGLLFFALFALNKNIISGNKYIRLAMMVLFLAFTHWIFLFHADLVPRTFIVDEGLTPFKVSLEYLVIVLNIFAAFIFYTAMKKPQTYDVVSLFMAVCIMAMSEVFFTIYMGLSDIFNLLGHVYKLIAYSYVYKAIFMTAVQNPYKELDKTQVALQHQYKLLDSILENIPHMVFLKDAKTLRFLMFNKTGEKLLGKNRDTFLGKNDYDLFAPQKAALFEEKDKEALASNQVIDIPYEEIDTVFGKRILHTKKISLLNEEGKAEYLLGISEDITAKVKAQEALIQSEKILRDSQKIAGLGSYALSLDTMLWKPSDVLLEIFGLDESYNLTTNDWLAILHPDDNEMMQEYFANEVLTKEKPFDKEYRIIRQNDKAVRWMHGLGKLRYKDDGTLKEMIGTIQDITERKETLETLVKLSLAVEQSPNSIVITDLDGNIEYVNAKFSAVTGYSFEEVFGKNPRILQSSKTPTETYDVMWKELQQGNTWEGELINKRKDGQFYIESAIISPVKATSGKITNYVAIKEDITEKKRAQEHIDNLAHFDQLTGLANRILFGSHAKYLLEHAKRTQTSVAIMFLDLDHFKDINDSLGHSIGDEVLKQTAQRLKNAVRSEDMVSRLGGDEFILIFPDTEIAQALNIATKVVEAVSALNLIEEYELTLTPSIGIAMYPNDGIDLETLLKNADTAMYRVKQEGRNGYSFFTQQMQENLSRNLELVNALRYALERDEFELYYQPQLSVDGKIIIGAEALLRWKHPLFGMVSPGEFIPIAEESGQIIKIGEWVLKTAIKQMKKWQDEGLQDMIVAVNLSAVQFKQANFSEHILEILQSVGLAHEFLELELTEAVTMNDPKAVISVMDKLHEQNIRMSIDDFGTGYSSLSYLKKFKIYKLKIDQSFIRDIHSDQDDRAIVTTIINMAKSLGIQTIAEGVETLEQLKFLRENDCNEIQGYYYSKPLTSSDFAAFVRSRG